LSGRQDLGRLAHEAHAGHHQRLRRVVAAEARHLQRVGHAAAGGQRQVLQVAVHVVVRHQHGAAGLQQLGGALTQAGALGGRQRRRHAGPGVLGAAAAGGVLPGVVEKAFGSAGAVFRR
jgi:hypothetical protein